MKLAAALILAAVCVALTTCLLMACSSSGGGPKTPASVSIAQLQDQLGRAQTDLTGPGGVLPTVEAMTPANVDVQRPVAVAKIETVATDLSVAATTAVTAKGAATTTEETVAKQAQQITDLKAADPVRTCLNIVGIGAIVAGVGVLIASIFVTFLYSITWLRGAAVGAVVFGFILVTIAHFLTEIYWIAGLSIGAALIGGGIWLWTHRKIVAAKAADAVGWVPALPTPPALPKP